MFFYNIFINITQIVLSLTLVGCVLVEQTGACMPYERQGKKKRDQGYLDDLFPHHLTTFNFVRLWQWIVSLIWEFVLSGTKIPLFLLFPENYLQKTSRRRSMRKMIWRWWRGTNDIQASITLSQRCVHFLPAWLHVCMLYLSPWALPYKYWTM